MKQGILWLVLLNKRLYRKRSFLALLLLIPLLVVCYSQIARQSSGFVSVALSREGRDPLAEALIESFVQTPGLMQFQLCSDPDEALELVRTGKVDSAWIFPEDMQEESDAFVADNSRKNAFVRVVQREDNVLLMLTREILASKLYSVSSPKLYLQGVRNVLPEAEALSDEQLLAYYDTIAVPDTLFQFSYSGKVPETDHLTAPIRGILAAIVVLGSLAAALYHTQDLSAGTFAWLREDRKGLVELAVQLLTTGNLGLAMVLGLCFSGLSVSLGWELLLLLGFCLSTAAFSMLLRRLCRKIPVLAALLPLLSVGLLILCPVFFDTGFPAFLPCLLPPTYYIRGVFDDRALWAMLLYTLICFGFSWLLDNIRSLLTLS